MNVYVEQSVNDEISYKEYIRMALKRHSVEK